jgi:hypothetical protein
MIPIFITHPDFADQVPRTVFAKEKAEQPPRETDEKFLNRHILFRRRFEIKKSGRAVIRISADDYYKLYINGRYVAAGPAPSYPCRYYYNELDVTEYLTEGENLIAVHTYYQGLTNRVWVSADRRHMLWLELSVDGETVLVSDGDFRVKDHSAYSAKGRIGYDTAFAERYDSRSSEIGFEKPDFDDTGWGFALPYAAADYTLEKQPTPVLTVYEAIPSTFRPGKWGHIYDFGREMVGYLYVEARGQSGDIITLRYGEELTEEGEVRHDMRCNCLYEEEWILSGKRDVLNQFDYKAFRYAQISLPEGVTLYSVKMLVRHYPYKERATFNKYGKGMEPILDLCRNTVKYGTQEVFVDCPSREKGQYLGDVSIAARAQAVLTKDTALMRKALRNFMDSCSICPGMMAVSTASLNQEIADYSLQFAHQVLWVYKVDGDKAFLTEALPYVLGINEYFKKFRTDKGLIVNTEKWNLVDWPKNLRDGYVFPADNLPHNVLNAFYVGFLKATDEILSILGEEPTGLTEPTERAFIDAFYDERIGLYSDDPEHTHVAIHSSILPLLFGIGTSDPELKERLIADVYGKKLTRVGVYMAYFALAALIVAGRRDLAHELMLDEGCWINMLREGATTNFEAWGKDQKWNTSLCHPWATAPVIILADDTPVY